MVLKLAMEAEKTWQRIRGHNFICNVIEGIRFVDGVIMKQAA
jgi:hypothetical protein